MESKIATLSENSINKIKQLESNLGVVLIAFDKEDNKAIDKQSK